MYESLVPILYYSPAITNQIQISTDEGIISSKTNTQKASGKVTIKAILDKLFIPVSAEISADGELAKETQTTRQFDDLTRAIKTVKEAQSETSVNKKKSKSCLILLNGVLYFEGDLLISTQKSMTDKSMMISITSKVGSKSIQGLTSIDNWVSNSLINNILRIGSIYASVIAIPLSTANDLITVQIACVFCQKR